VLDAIRQTPRHELIPQRLWDQAYVDSSLPIGDQQTISSPFIVASMTQVIDPQPTDKVLEIGTGSGYQAAVLSPLVDQVYTIEIVERLGRKAEQDLRRLGYENVSVRVGDGFKGWPEAAPFDKIIVTCSPESVPEPLVEQLREGGLMVIPVGERYQQTLYLLHKVDGKLEEKRLEPTLFVPMTGEAETQRNQQPDPLHPALINGDFEVTGEQPVDIPGWYYGRQVEQISGDAAVGKGFIRFQNSTPGRDSHLMQGVGLDGRSVKRVRLAARARTQRVELGQGPQDKPVVAITFYDSQRRELGTQWLGPFRGTTRWTSHARELRVPIDTREAIVRVGLFGATGTADFDEILLEPK
jgi:protein-L-isoaspartate(D-aspartate) O-methyltransferase